MLGRKLNEPKACHPQRMLTIQSQVCYDDKNRAPTQGKRGSDHHIP